MSQTEAIQVEGICTKCGHRCMGFLTQQQITAGTPIICCGNSDSTAVKCGNKIANYEKTA